MLALETAKVIAYQQGRLEASYRIPHNICMAKKGDVSVTGQVGVGAVLALADVFTTLVLVAADGNHRPGILWMLYNSS